MAALRRAPISGHFQRTPDGALYQRDCAPCHTSQLRYATAAAEPSTARFLRVASIAKCAMAPLSPTSEAMQSRTARPVTRAAAARRFSEALRRKNPLLSARNVICSPLFTSQSASGAVNFAASAGPFYRPYSMHLLSDFTRKAFFAPMDVFAPPRSSAKRSCDRVVSAKAARHAFVPRSRTPKARRRIRIAQIPRDSDQMCLQCHASLERKSRAPYAPRSGNRSQPLRRLPYATQHGRAAVPRAVASDRRDSRRSTDRAFRRSRQPQRLFGMPSRPLRRVAHATAFSMEEFNCKTEGQTMKSSLRVLAVIVAATGAAAIASAQRLSESTGINLFATHCTQCHGLVPAEHAPTEATIQHDDSREHLCSDHHGHHENERGESHRR